MCNLTKEAPSTAYTTDAVHLTASTVTQKVAGADPQRRTVTVINDPDGTDPVYVVGQQNQNSATGIKLKPGAGLTLNTVAPVYVVAPAAATVYVSCETGSLL